MDSKSNWYKHGNIVSVIAFYMEPKEILKAMLVCKTLNQHLNSNKIWWMLYNNAFNTVRVIDQAQWLESENEGVCPAKQAFRNMKRAKLTDYKVSPENQYRVWLFGRYDNLH